MKLRQNIIANYAGQGWSALMSIAFVPVYIHQLGIESYALIGIFAVLQAWLILLDLGMSPTLGREMARFSAGALSAPQIRDLLRSIEIVCGGIAVAAALAIALGAGFIATGWLKTTLPFDTVRNALFIMGVVVAMRFCETIYRSALFGLERQLWYNAVNIVVVTLRFGGAAAVLHFVSPTIEAFFVWQLLVSAIALSLFSAKLYRVLPAVERRARFSMPAIREVWAFASGMIGINILALILSQADKVVLSKALPLANFGYYTLATTVCGVIVAATGPISQAIFPTLTRYHASEDRLQFDSAYHFAAQLVSIAAAAIASPLMFFPYEVVLTWSGDPLLAQNVTPLLRLLAAGTLCNGLMQIPYFALLALGRTRFALILNAIAVAVILPALLVAVPGNGAIAAAAVWMSLNIGLLIIGTPLLHRRYLPGQFASWALHDVLVPLAAAAGIGLVLRAIAPAADAGRLIWFLYLGISTGLIGLAALGGAVTVRHMLINVLKRLAAPVSHVTR